MRLAFWLCLVPWLLLLFSCEVLESHYSTCVFVLWLNDLDLQ